MRYSGQLGESIMKYKVVKIIKCTLASDINELLVLLASKSLYIMKYYCKYKERKADTNSGMWDDFLNKSNKGVL